MPKHERYFVTCEDTSLSGWGPAAGKINKLIFACSTEDEAAIVADNAGARDDMHNIETWCRSAPPSFDESRFFVQHKNRKIYPSWYKAGYFSKN